MCSEIPSRGPEKLQNEIVDTSHSIAYRLMKEYWTQRDKAQGA